MKESGPERVEPKPGRGIAGDGCAVEDGLHAGPQRAFYSIWLEKTRKDGAPVGRRLLLTKRGVLGCSLWLKTFTTAFYVKGYSVETMVSGRPD